MSESPHSFQDVLLDLLKMERNQNLKVNGALENLESFMNGIAKVENCSLEKDFQCLVQANTVEKQMMQLKQLVSKYSTEKQSSDFNPINDCRSDEILVYEIITKIYFGVDLKNPVRSGIVKLVSSLSDMQTELIRSALLNELKLLLSDTELNVNRINKIFSRLVGCFENFPIGCEVVHACQAEVLNYVNVSLIYCIGKLRKPELSPSVKGEVFQCIHLIIRLALLIMQNLTDSPDIECLKSTNTLISSVLELSGLPLDTANNCGHFICLFAKETRQSFSSYVDLLNAYGSDNNVTTISLCSGLLNSHSAEELIASDYGLLKLISEKLIDIYDRFTNDCVVILCLSRALLVLSRCLLSIPKVFTVLPHVYSFFITYTWTHLDHHMDSVRHLSSNILYNVVKVMALSSTTSSTKDRSMLDEMLKKTIVTPVWKRAKHIALQALSEEISSTEILNSEQDLVKTLLKSLLQPSVPTYMIDSVDKLMFQHLNEVGVKVWTDTWIEPLLNALKESKGRYHGLQKLLTKVIHESSETVDHILSQDRDWLVSFSVLQACRKLGIKITEEDSNVKWRGLIEYSFFTEATYHADPEVRLSCFETLNESKKSTEHFTEKELELIKLCITSSMDDYDSAVHHRKLGLMKKFLTRIVDSSQALKRSNKGKDKFTENRIAKAVKYQDQFVEWLASFSFSNLFVGANLGRRSTALSILSIIHDMNVWPTSVTNSENADLLFLCLTDSYEDNKMLAKKLLTSMPERVVRFDDKSIVKELFETALELGSSFRPPDCITGAYVIGVLVTYPSAVMAIEEFTHLSAGSCPLGGTWIAILAAMKRLTKEVSIAQENLLAAVATGPLHGQLLIIRHLLESIDLNAISKSPEWTTVISNLISLCYKCSDSVASVVNNDSPEGHLPLDVSEQGKEDNANNKINVTAQMVLLCAWRTIKEVSLILGHIAKHASISTKKIPGLLSKEQLISIGDHLTLLLAETKHRGAFEQAYIGFCKLAGRLWRFRDGDLHKLPYKWLQETVEEIASSSKICATRRSAGIPYIIQALVCTEKGVGDGSCFSTCMKRLLELASSDDYSVDTRINALNILRALFRNAELSEAVSVYVQNAFIVSISGFNSPSWGERNASTLLFSAMMTRVFGVKRTKGYDLNWKNKMTGRIFFKRYPELYNFLLHQLVADKSCESIDRPTLYPVLLLLSRLYPSSLEGTDSNLKLSEFLDPLIACSGSPVMKIRLCSGRAAVPLVSPNRCVEHIERLFGLITESKRENFIHGLIIQIAELLKNDQLIENADEVKLKTHVESWVQSLICFIKARRYSLIVKNEFIKVLNIFHTRFRESVSDSVWNDFCTHLKDHLRPRYYESVAVPVGISQYEIAAMEFLLKLKLYSGGDQSIVYDLFTFYYKSKDCCEIRSKILDIIFYLISYQDEDEKQQQRRVHSLDDDEDYMSVCNNLKSLTVLQRSLLKTFIIDSKLILYLVFDQLLAQDANVNMDRLFDILSYFPHILTHIIGRLGHIEMYVKSKNINIDNEWNCTEEDDDLLLVLKFVCKLPYHEEQIRSLLNKTETEYICRIIVKYIYQSDFILDPSVRMLIANWFNTGFFIDAIRLELIPWDIRLSLWGYYAMLCLDEDKDVECGISHRTVCPMKSLEATLSAFAFGDMECNLVRFCAMLAWSLGRIRFKDRQNTIDKFEEKPLDKNEVESCYEEVVFSKVCSKYQKELFDENPNVIYEKIPMSVKSWMAAYCKIPDINNANCPLDVIHIVLSSLSKNVQRFDLKSSTKYCDCLRYGFKTFKLFHLKMDCSILNLKR